MMMPQANQGNQMMPQSNQSNQMMIPVKVCKRLIQWPCQCPAIPLHPISLPSRAAFTPASMEHQVLNWANRMTGQNMAYAMPKSGVNYNAPIVNQPVQRPPCLSCGNNKAINLQGTAGSGMIPSGSQGSSSPNSSNTNFWIYLFVFFGFILLCALLWHLLTCILGPKKSEEEALQLAQMNQIAREQIVMEQKQDVQQSELDRLLDATLAKPPPTAIIREQPIAYPVRRASPSYAMPLEPIGNSPSSRFPTTRFTDLNGLNGSLNNNDSNPLDYTAAPAHLGHLPPPMPVVPIEVLGKD